MKFKKAALSLLLTTAFVISATGCSSKETAETTAVEKEITTEEDLVAKEAEADEYYEAGRIALYGLDGTEINLTVAYENFVKAVELGSIGEEIGIEPGDALISINNEEMKASLESEHREDLFDSMKNFTSSLLRKSGEVTLDPMKYVDKKVVAYKNPGKTFSSPYTSSIYSGMMFNSYC